MLRLAADENFNGHIVDALRRRIPNLDLLRVQDVGLKGADDPVVLAWAASEERILLTHDRRTVPRFSYDRVADGLAMPGVFAVSETLPVGDVIADLALLIECSLDGEWEGQVCHLPL